MLLRKSNITELKLLAKIINKRCIWPINAFSLEKSQKLERILAKSASITGTEKKTKLLFKRLVTDKILFINYLVWFKKNKNIEIILALIDFFNEVNTMALIYAVKQHLKE